MLVILNNVRLRWGLFVVLGVALVIRLAIEAFWLLPSPVADTVYFLTASINYCQSGFLGTTTFPIDPTGHARMVWHGFVSPMLFGLFSPGCSALGFYVTLWAIKAVTTAGIVRLSHARQAAPLSICGLAAFTLAAQTLIAFRPETLGILFIVLSELAFEYEFPVLFGVVLGSLLCTQPTVAGLYGLVLLIARFKWLWERRLSICAGYLGAVVVLLTWYPFPLRDLITGIGLQAKLLIGRTDGSVWWYYIVVPFLPLWGALFLISWAYLIARNWLFLLLAPAFWYFGPRLPPTYYNLIPINIALMTIASTRLSKRANSFIALASLAIGSLGLGMLTMRDVLTIARYGDTFHATRGLVSKIIDNGARLDSSRASFIALTNPNLRVTDPNVAPAHGSTGKMIEVFSVNGRRASPCGSQASHDAVSLGIGRFTLFNTNSGWMIYVCRKSA